MVPLVRPHLPKTDDWLQEWLDATNDTGQYSNFGAMWKLAAQHLSDITGRIALPCSNGTEAVALAIMAADMPNVLYEAFTFQATELAAKRCNRHAVAIRTGQSSELDDCVVRTVPFGVQRDFGPEAGQLVIDAAGAFGPGAFDTYPEDAIIACSFHATKNFPIGEGGCVFLPAGWDRQARMVRAAMNFGLDEQRNYLRFLPAGNGKMDEMHAAMLVAQLRNEAYFLNRSKRIGHDSQLAVRTIKGARLPYTPGKWQSLVVIQHPEPTALVAKLGAAGYIARQVYHPFIKPDLMTYEQARLVALPSDCTTEEFWGMLEAADA